jgi:hypothetical protein
VTESRWSGESDDTLVAAASRDRDHSEQAVRRILAEFRRRRLAAPWEPGVAARAASAACAARTVGRRGYAGRGLVVAVFAYATTLSALACGSMLVNVLLLGVARPLDRLYVIESVGGLVGCVVWMLLAGIAFGGSRVEERLRDLGLPVRLRWMLLVPAISMWLSTVLLVKAGRPARSSR